MSEDEIKEKLKIWMCEKNCSIEQEDLIFSTNIIEKKVITSMQIMDLILYIESIRGAPIEPSQIEHGAFQSIDSIYKCFFN